MFFKKKIRYLIGCLLILILLVPSVSLADTPACSITLVLEDEEGQAIDNVSVSACQIAKKTTTGYYPTTAFEDSGISIAGILNHPTSDMAKDILNFMKNEEIEGIQAISVSGEAVFSDLAEGIWIAYCDEGQDYNFPPFLLLLPQVINGQADYDVISIPKVAPVLPEVQMIHVVKQWDDNNDAAGKRPEQIVVHLLQNDIVIDSVELNAACGWAHTYAIEVSPAEAGEITTAHYSVEEVAVDGYTASYNGDVENGFVITNSYENAGGKLPQTGQLWWPILLLSVAGAAFVVLGVVEVKGRRDGKESA